MARVRPGVSVLALLLAGCLYDADHPCGAHQRYTDQATCVCDDETVVVGTACQPCPDGEVIAAGACTCPGELVRDVTGNCAVPPSGQGVTCSPTEVCATAADPVCAAADYCTRDCATTADCAGGYACDLAAPTPYCERPPSGLETPCTSQADCMGFDASYCETLQAHVCLVAGCVVGDAEGCFPGWTCCDLSSFGFTTTLCVPDGQCPT